MMPTNSGVLSGAVCGCCVGVGVGVAGAGLTAKAVAAVELP